ncbi:oxygenase MpaB family protein [Solwaraspora sp. WMMD1047]|uniref:oxygenase MpaB family protein n=1 Tax=Solwaraspora sp. WMMD1047 TaxID=3016102 RepID=UPI002416F034|nr:oxygenase MpaB family protein [Solwaraspora sp. WMMD1047]MDG4829899.1 oxygenase MpaB family protein [Solwaraspora sp. WMMD1047]
MAEQDGQQVDFGAFGPDSVTWRVFREPTMYLGGLRAVFLQALHPRAIAGVVQNCDLRTDGYDRVLRGLRHLNTVAWAPTPVVDRAARVVRACHRHATAIDRATGDVIRVDEPDLLRWVHVTQMESHLTAVRLSGARFSPSDVDRYFAEWLRGAELVGLDPRTVPATAAEVEEYYREMRPRLSLGAEGRATREAMFHPVLPGNGITGLPGALRVWQTAVSVALGLTPAWARKLLGYRGRGTTTAAARTAAISLRIVLKTTPQRVYRSAVQADADRRVALSRNARLAR